MERVATERQQHDHYLILSAMAVWVRLWGVVMIDQLGLLCVKNKLTRGAVCCHRGMSY